jgi:hypothetical protein
MLNTAKDWDFAKFDLGITAQTMLLGRGGKGVWRVHARSH